MFFYYLSFITSVVNIITPKNAGKYFSGKPPSIVKFYSPSCPHCIEIKKDFKDASEKSSIQFAEVNCAESKTICKRYVKDGYPTILFFDGSDKKGIEYVGKRTKDSFLSFIKINQGMNHMKKEKMKFESKNRMLNEKYETKKKQINDDYDKKLKSLLQNKKIESTSRHSRKRRIS
ncbi:Protein disulfide-isomerase-like protein EhSep2 [Tritrichomonas foetus]|uniref:Protein disulfide-isomerase-like protein EhSep2 n=1 Tax=Tritrichomonas foetus TaxID=1144522 RepID=A0A1J4JJS2_9EUKA|nr:Protein disulfide-isomerase-like protein EhSep2 [Tritrichomonas foetus]|eukprot:OHS97771.1 Protein disulfide-isomerase-like protein EhSep2 [Tritrichomonas foetus]